MPTDADRTIGELARRLDEIATRFESLANRLDTTYTRRELFDSYQKLATAEHARLTDADKTLADATNVAIATVTARVTDLEEGRKWLSRATVGAVLAALGALLVTVLKAKTGGL